MSRFLFHPSAKAELTRAIAWYDAQSSGLGNRFEQAFEKALSDIDQYPLAYPAVRSRWRRLLIRRFPYGIIYRPAGDTIYILAIFHSSRNPKRWRERL